MNFCFPSITKRDSSTHTFIIKCSEPASVACHVPRATTIKVPSVRLAWRERSKSNPSESCVGTVEKVNKHIWLTLQTCFTLGIFVLYFEMRLSFRAFGALDLQSAVSRSSFSVVRTLTRFICSSSCLWRKFNFSSKDERSFSLVSNWVVLISDPAAFGAFKKGYLFSQVCILITFLEFFLSEPRVTGCRRLRIRYGRKWRWSRLSLGLTEMGFLL